MAKRTSEFTNIAEAMAGELKNDVSYIMSLGIKLEKGKLATKAGGTAWAGFEVFTGDWLTALFAGGLALTVGSLTNAYGRIKVQEMRKKWFEILSSLDEEQLSCLMATIRRRYPLLLSQVQHLLQA